MNPDTPHDRRRRLNKLLNQFENGVKRYQTNAIFNQAIDAILYGKNLIDLIGDLLNIIESQEAQIKALSENKPPLEKPTMEKYGWRNQVGHDDQPGGWMFEGGEDAYYEALAQWDLQQNKKG